MIFGTDDVGKQFVTFQLPIFAVLGHETVEIPRPVVSPAHRHPSMQACRRKRWPWMSIRLIP
jgi:hypothetical protein